jgi:hypothetical protein
MGMMLPGQYWFLTLTTAPKSKHPVRDDWHKTWQNWFRKKFSPVENLWVETLEGLGVVHAVVRFPVGGFSIPTKEEVADQWQWQHQAFSDWTLARDNEKLANYMMQKHEPVAGEIKKQRDVVDWSYSRGWLPVGFPAVFGRAWWEMLRFVPDFECRRIIADWMHAVKVNKENLNRSPVFDGSFIIEDYIYD